MTTAEPRNQACSVESLHTSTILASTRDRLLAAMSSYLKNRNAAIMQFFRATCSGQHLRKIDRTRFPKGQLIGHERRFKTSKFNSRLLRSNRAVCPLKTWSLSQSCDMEIVRSRYQYELPEEPLILELVTEESAAVSSSSVL
jgi:hypothetical protein